MFDQLTSATPKRVEKKMEEESEEEEEVVEEGSDEEVEPKKPYFTEDQPYRCIFNFVAVLHLYSTVLKLNFFLFTVTP